MPDDTPKTAREIKASRALIAWASYRLKVGAVADDLFARARIVEGALGLPQWSLAGNPRSLIEEGPGLVPDADPEWFSPRDQKIRESVLKGIMSVINDSSRAEDIYQDMTTGFDGAERNDIYGYIGKTNNSAFKRGSFTIPKAKAALRNWGKRRAISENRKLQNLNEMGLDVPGEGEEVFDITSPEAHRDWKTSLRTDMADILATILQGRRGRAFEKWMKQNLRSALNPMQEKILEIDLEGWRKGRSPYGPLKEDNRVPAKILAKTPDVYELGRTGNPVGPRTIVKARNATIKKMRKVLEKALQSDSQLQEWVEEVYMSRRASKEKMAARVASQWLQVPGTKTARRTSLINEADDFVEMAGDSMGLTPEDYWSASSKTLSLIRKFESQVERALEEWAAKNPLRGDYEADDLMDDSGPYNILMTLRGEGVGIWDGRWDHYFQDRRDIKRLERFLTKKLGRWADDTGSGILNNAFMDDAYESADED